MIDDEDMTNRVVLVTGATGGIGRAAARRLGGRGATVVVTGRSRERGQAAVAEIEQAGGEGAFVRADFAAMAAVRGLADAFRKRYDRLDVLIHNAACSHDERRVTDDGYEKALAVNHLAPYLLTHELLDLLRASAPARVVSTSSTVHRRGAIDLDDLQLETDYDALDAYARSKLANLLFTTELAARLDGTGVTANAVHPGFVPDSGLYRDASMPVRAATAVAARLPFVGTSVQDAADGIVRLAAASEEAEINGTYFEGCERADLDSRLRDERLRERLWNASADLVGVDPAWP
ncbi:SDR family NAD(P)-dependent oxidoreductase [Halococcus saccharolyticus]|uniref:Short-chain dehydrogenase/reductase SDR n=1 Tax=Halococcus saccharolyticus DSM 5350 TaxID=1227455 RepID=M0MQJ9_9EURY|nr:SDR family NAD(P)-dependent oxidoreductase [Halococcus saccharolyticus]EMA46999.1 short-chain dehydrogenase/reductase SDR [Halococcus saccharolyticus DSM 5350]